MSGQSGRSRGRSPGALRTAVVAALVEQPGHGYDLANRLGQRMGPALQVDPRRVYEVLLQLEKEGMAAGTDEPSPSAPHRIRRVFTATALARSTHARWLEERQQVPSTRSNVHALIAFSTPEQAPELLRMLDEYEIDCMEMQERAIGPNVEAGSWRGRMIATARAAVCKQLQAELSWIAMARREIEDYLASR